MTPTTIEAYLPPTAPFANMTTLPSCDGMSVSVDTRNHIHAAGHVFMPMGTIPSVSYWSDHHHTRRTNGFSPMLILDSDPLFELGIPDIWCGGNTGGMTPFPDDVHVVWHREGAEYLGDCPDPEPTPIYAPYKDIHYARKQAGGWTIQPLTFAARSVTTEEDFEYPQVQVDSAGFMHVIARRTTRTYTNPDLCMRSPSATVVDAVYMQFDLNVAPPPPPAALPPVIFEVIPGVVPNAGYHNLRFDLDSGFAPHVVWEFAGPNVAYIPRTGTPWAGMTVLGAPGDANPDIALNSTNVPQIVWEVTTAAPVPQVFHTNGVTPVTPMQVSMETFIASGRPRILVDSRDQHHVVWSGLDYAAQVNNPGPGLDPTWRLQTPIENPNQFVMMVQPWEAAITADDQLVVCDDNHVTKTMEYDLGVKDPAAIAGILPGGSANLATGNFHMSIPLFGTAGVGPLQSASAFYNAMDQYGGFLSQGWRLNWEIYLIDHHRAVNDPNFVSTPPGEDTPYETVTLVLPDGRHVPFFFESFTGDGTPQTAFLRPYDEGGLIAKIERLSYITLNPEYTLTWKSGDVWVFNGQGKLRRIEDPAGNYLELLYTDGYLTTIRDQLPGSGRSTTISYEASSNALYTSRIETLTDPTMKTYTFAYSGNHLISIQFTSAPSQPTHSFTYATMHSSGSGARIGMMDLVRTPRGHVGGYGWTVRYQQDNRVGEILDPMESYLLDSQSDGDSPGPQTATLSIAYTEGLPAAFPRVATLTDRRGSNFEYRLEYRRALALELLDPFTGTAGLVSVQRTFDPFGNVISVRDRWNFTTTYTYDPPWALPNLIANDNLASVTRPNASGGGTELVAEYTYDHLPIPHGYNLTLRHLSRLKTTKTWATKTDDTSATGRTTLNDYDTVGRLTSVRHPDVTRPDGESQSNVTTNFEYNGTRGAMSRAVNERGNGTTYSNFHGTHALPQTVNRDGGTEADTFQYDDMGNTTQHTAPQGGSDCTPTTSYQLDGMYRVEKVTDAAGKETNFGYDVDSNRTTVTPAAGGASTTTYDKRGFVSGGTSPDGNWSQVVDANGNVRRTTNIRGYATNHTLDALNRVTETRTPGDSSIGGSGGYSGGNHVVQYAYDIQNGSLRDSTVTRVGSTNRVTTTQFDARGRAKMVIEPDGMTKMETIYDEQDQVVATHKWFGSNLQSATVNFRDARDRVDRVRTQDAAYSPGGSPTNHLSTYSLYNKAGSVEVSVSPLGSPSGSTHRTTYTLDPRERATEVRDGTNNLVSKTDYFDDDLVKETFVPDPVGKGTGMVSARKYTYTCRKELKTSENRNCAGSTTVYGNLPGQVDEITDALGRVAKTEYDSSTQRPTAQWTAYGTAGASKVESVWTNGLLTQTKVFNPSTGSYDATYSRTYDKANRLELFSYPSGLGLSSEATSYNSFGETLAMITTSRTITHAYNTLGQNITKTWSGAYSNVVTMEYDDAGHQKTLSEGSGGSQLRKETTFHVWKGTPNVETFKVGGSTWRFQTHVHDVSGNYVKFTDPEGKNHEWTVDNAGRVQDVKHDGVVVLSLTYTPGGLLDTTTVNNASGTPIFKTTHYYDELGRKSRQVTAKSSNGAVISAYRWEYDAGDRVVKLKLEHLGVEFVYGYDERDQLISETTEGNSATGAPAFTNNIVSLPVGNEGAASNEPTMQTQNVLAVNARSASWTYDKAGNRTAMTIDGVSTTFSYNAGSQLTSETWASKTVSHTYDEWGNETVRTTVEGANTTVETYGYNYLNVMSSYVRTYNSVTQSNWQYQFWPTGDRYGKVDLVTSSNSEYYVPRMGDVAADYTSTLAIKNTYVQGTGIDSKSIRIPWSGSSPDNANRRHYIGDLVGTIGMTLTESATVAETSVKDAWGNQLAGSTTERYGGLAQRESDGESSLVFVRARMYDPVRGRFTQTDPPRGRRARHHYKYVSNNPLGTRDPLGLQDEADEEDEDPDEAPDADANDFDPTFDYEAYNKDLKNHGAAYAGFYAWWGSYKVIPDPFKDPEGWAEGTIEQFKTAVSKVGGALKMAADGFILLEETVATGAGVGLAGKIIWKLGGKAFTFTRTIRLNAALRSVLKTSGFVGHAFEKHGATVSDGYLWLRLFKGWGRSKFATKFLTDGDALWAITKIITDPVNIRKIQAANGGKLKLTMEFAKNMGTGFVKKGDKISPIVDEIKKVTVYIRDNKVVSAFPDATK